MENCNGFKVNILLTSFADETKMSVIKNTKIGTRCNGKYDVYYDYTAVS